MELIRGSGQVVYRLVRNKPASRGDFQPRAGKAFARETRLPELLRLGISHYLTREDVEAVNVQESMVARLTLDDRFYFARTGHIKGHIDVWARVEEYVEVAEIEP